MLKARSYESRIESKKPNNLRLLHSKINYPYYHRPVRARSVHTV